MPADTKARYYQWFMTDEHNARLVGYEWHPEGEFTSSMTLGRLTFMHREEVGDTWGPPIEVASEDRVGRCTVAGSRRGVPC